MPRNPNEARLRLQRAALDLFTENGFDETTAAQIAERAGLTERTFFRHFPNKADILFDSQKLLETALNDAIRQVPANLPPLQALQQALFAIAPIFEEHRNFSEPRQKIIAATPVLREREMAKGAALAETVSLAMQSRGVDSQRAGLAAQIGFVVLTQALEAWFADSRASLADCMATLWSDVRDLAGAINPR